jgi:hypothetical protein
MGCEIMQEYYSIAAEKTKLAMEGRLKPRPMNTQYMIPKSLKINLEYELEEATEQ